METEYRRQTQAPLSERVCDTVCVLFAVWTLCCHFVVITGGSFSFLLALALGVYGLLGLFFACSWTRGWYATVTQSGLRQRIGSVTTAARFEWLPDLKWLDFSPQFRNRMQGAGLILGLTGALAVLWHGNIVVLWAGMVGLLSIAAVVFLLTEIPALPCATANPVWEGGLWGLACVCLVLTLISHRSDADDAFYVNVAVAAVDFPQQALFSRDTLHGIEGLPLHLPVYRVHSYELWNGALSYLTGIPAIYCFHWVSAAIAALLVPLAQAKLFRLLTPQQWLWAVCVLVIVLVATGETHRWYGNFVFVRLWQGKSIFLAIFLPLVYAYAIRFALQPGWRSGALLGAAQIAAIGCSSSALWAAPVSALMALCSVLPPARAGLRILGLGVLSSGYLLGTAWLMREGMQNRFSAYIPDVFVPGEKLGQALPIILGNTNLWFVGITALCIAWACCRQGLARRFAIGVPLVALVVLLNPYAAEVVMANITGPSYWRSFWAVPIPILLTLVLIAPLQLDGSRGKRICGQLACLALVAAFVACVPAFHGLSPKNRVRIGLPSLKVPAAAYQWAAALNQSVPPGASVLAPEEVNTWIPTFHEHAYPVQVRGYLSAYRKQLGMENLLARTGMIRYVAGKARRRDQAKFRHGLDRFAIQAVCIRHSAYLTEAQTILQQAGFQQTRAGDEYDIWIRL